MYFQIMNIKFDITNKKRFTSKSRRFGYMAEQWIASNMYCPICGYHKLKQLSTNTKASDFICPKCKEFYELKSDNSKKVPKSLMGGNYDVYKAKFRSAIKPNILYLQHDKSQVINLFFIHKDLITIKNIKKRKKPLKRNKDYYMCTISLLNISSNKMFSIIANSDVINKNRIINKFKKKLIIKNESKWIYCTINIINSIWRKYFHLKDFNCYIKKLQKIHPNNKHIPEKIRQTLQYIAKLGYIDSLGKGYYVKKY